MSIYELTMQFMQKLDEAGFEYEDLGEGSIRVYCSGDNINSYDMVVTFGSSETMQAHMMIHCYAYFNYNEKMYAGLNACNQANEDAAFARFSLDEDGDACASAGTFYHDFDADHALKFFGIVAVDIDDAYPFFAKAYWA